jgi:predicted MPP superfamily phosphohydrolase
LGGLAVAGAGLSTACLGSAYTTLVEPGWLQRTATSIRLPRLPSALDGLSVALLSDLHVGPHVSPAQVRRAVTITNGSGPDVIIVAGDFVSQSASHSNACAVELAALRAPHGVFAVLGNHDVWTDADAVAANVSAAGLHVLRDERVPIETNGSRLWLLGIEDTGYMGGGFDTFRARWAGAEARLRELLTAIPPGEPCLLLVHNPDFTEMAAPGEVDLALCGHTHGGQVRLPFVGPPVVPSCFGAKYAAGLVQGPGTLVYVTRGVGLIAPRVRFNCRPEVSLLRLHAA